MYFKSSRIFTPLLTNFAVAMLASIFSYLYQDSEFYIDILRIPIVRSINIQNMIYIKYTIPNTCKTVTTFTPSRWWLTINCGYCNCKIAWYWLVLIIPPIISAILIYTPTWFPVCISILSYFLAIWSENLVNIQPPPSLYIALSVSVSEQSWIYGSHCNLWIPHFIWKVMS